MTGGGWLSTSARYVPPRLHPVQELEQSFEPTIVPITDSHPDRYKK